jgi:hypothetical protein
MRSDALDSQILPAQLESRARDASAPGIGLDLR